MLGEPEALVPPLLGVLSEVERVAERLGHGRAFDDRREIEHGQRWEGHRLHPARTAAVVDGSAGRNVPGTSRRLDSGIGMENLSVGLDGLTGRFRFASPRLALLLGLFALVLLAVGLPLASLADQFTWDGIGISLPIAPFAIVGFVLARRVPRNPIGWILLALVLAAVGGMDAGFYAVRAYRLGDHGLPFARLGVFLAIGWFWLLLLMPPPIALFPDGRLPPRWRWTLPAMS